MENSVLCKLPRYPAFTLAWDQRHCTKPLYTGWFWGPGGLWFGGAGSSCSGSGACPKHRTARAEVPSSARVGFCRVYFANEPFGGFTDAAGPCCAAGRAVPCARAQPRCHRLLEPLSVGMGGCPGSSEPPVPWELPGPHCGGMPSPGVPHPPRCAPSAPFQRLNHARSSFQGPSTSTEAAMWQY